MEDDIVIRVDNVSKDFILPHERINSIKSVFTGFMKRKGRKTKETQHALKNISFEIKKGEFFGIVGRNGSGKSTLLKILAGIYQPSVGSVSVSGKLVPFIELGVGFNAELTGRENVYLNGAMLGFSKREIDKMYDDIVSFAELEKFMDQKLKNYSSGMQVRLAFSMATRAEADILLVDEVLAVGDAAFQRKCFNYFRELKKNKKTVVFVSHDMTSVREYCDRGILIEDSLLVMSGSANSIADQYTKLFIPSGDQKTSLGSDRVGDRRFVFDKVSVPNKLTDKDKKIDIVLSCKVNDKLQDANVGIKLKDQLDRPLLGTNTNIAGIDITDLKAKDRLSVKFSFDNLLNAGIYKLDVVAVAKDGSTYDWWTNAAEINVYKEKQTGYPIDPKIKVELI